MMPLLSGVAGAGLRFEPAPLKARGEGGSAFPVSVPRRSRVQVLRNAGKPAPLAARGRLRHLSTPLRRVF